MAEPEGTNYEEQDDFDLFFGDDEEEETVEQPEEAVEEQPVDGSKEFLSLAQQVKNDQILNAYTMLRGEGLSDVEAIKHMYEYMKGKGMYAEAPQEEETFQSAVKKEIDSLKNELNEYKRKEMLREVSSKNAGKAFNILNKYGIEATDGNAAKYNKALMDMYPKWDGSNELTEVQVKNIVQLAFAKDMAARRKNNQDSSRQEGVPKILNSLSSGGMSLRDVRKNLNKTDAVPQVSTSDDRISRILKMTGL